jgi:hypothetical protein
LLTFFAIAVQSYFQTIIPLLGLFDQLKFIRYNLWATEFYPFRITHSLRNYTTKIEIEVSSIHGQLKTEY